MTMIKRGTTKSRVIVSSSIYVCGCGHTEMASSLKKKSKKCPKCGEIMNLMAGQDEKIEEK